MTMAVAVGCGMSCECGMSCGCGMSCAGMQDQCEGPGVSRTRWVMSTGKTWGSQELGGPAVLTGGKSLP